MYINKYMCVSELPWWLRVKNLPAMWETRFQPLGHREDPLEKGMATHPSILALRIPGTEKPVHGHICVYVCMCLYKIHKII